MQITIEGQTYNVYVQKRPGVDQFIKSVSELYEVVIYTASISKYAAPLIEKLDPLGLTSHCLFRNHCSVLSNSFVKDLSLLGRELNKTIIIDNTPSAYMLQPDNAIPIQTWMGDLSDRRLAELIPILEILATVRDVRGYIRRVVKNYEVNYNHTLLQLREEVLNRKLVSRYTVTPTQVPERPETIPQIRPKPVPIHIRISKGSIEFPKSNPYTIKPTTASTLYSPAGFSTAVTPLADAKPRNYKREQIETAMNIRHSLEYGILSSSSSPKQRVQKPQRIILPKEMEGMKKNPFRPTTTSVVEPSPRKIKSTRCASMATIKKETEKIRISTAAASPREIMHQIRHVGALIKQSTIQSPIYMTSEKRNVADIRIRYVIASAYDNHT